MLKLLVQGHQFVTTSSLLKWNRTLFHLVADMNDLTPTSLIGCRVMSQCRGPQVWGGGGCCCTRLARGVWVMQQVISPLV